jgi:hypothetical protein
MTVKEHVHRLIEGLPERDLHAARRFLEYLRAAGSEDLMLSVSNEAPEDDEPTTPEEDEGARQGWEAYLRGEGIPAEEAKRELLG